MGFAKGIPIEYKIPKNRESRTSKLQIKQEKKNLFILMHSALFSYKMYGIRTKWRRISRRLHLHRLLFFTYSFR